MKFFSATASILGLASLAVVQGAGHDDNIIVGDNDFFQLASLASGPHGKCDQFDHCATLRRGRLRNGTPLKLNNCLDDDTEGWRVVTEGTALTFHAGNDNDKCLQAGNGAAMGTWNRARMRLYPCDPTEPLQRFHWKATTAQHDECGGGVITLEDDNTMCVTWRGRTANPGKDAIIALPCAKLDAQRALGWIAR